MRILSYPWDCERFYSGSDGRGRNGHSSHSDNSGGHKKGEHRSKGPSATAAETGMHIALLKCIEVSASFLLLPCAEKTCPICLDGLKTPTKTKCGHQFCSACLSKALQYDPYCPTCKHVLRPIVGKQPRGGQMTHRVCTTVQ